VTDPDESSNDRRERRRLDPDIRRAEIIAAATRIFAARPYDTIALADIAKEAGASRALISHYFGDKAGLFAAVAATFAAGAAQAIRTDQDLPLPERLAANIDSALSFAADNRETVLALLPTGPAGYDTRMRNIVDTLRNRIVDRMLTNHFGTTDLPPRYRFALRAYTGLFSVAVGDWLREETVDRRYVSEYLANTMLSIVAELRQRADQD
jgi:AcrR family transcriptional regulator